ALIGRLLEGGLDVGGKFAVGLGARLPQTDRRPMTIVRGEYGVDARLVVVDDAVELRERHAIDQSVGLQAELVGLDLQADPLARRRQWAGEKVLRAVGRPRENALVLAPIGAVFPDAVVILEH